MKILLVNDDGYDRGGLPALSEALEACGHEIWIAAPSENCSGKSHSMNLTSEIHFTRFGRNRYHCSGTPVDCVLYAIKGKLFDSRPDLVIAGINRGPNCSTDITYSGTCGAAREAIYQRIPAISLSQGRPLVKGGPFDYESCARWTAENLDRLMSLAGLDSFVNVNFPNPFSERVQLGDIGYINYPDRPEKWDKGEVITMAMNDGYDFGIDMRDRGKGDLEIIHEGCISISVIRALPALDDEMMARAEKLFL